MTAFIIYFYYSSLIFVISIAGGDYFFGKRQKGDQLICSKTINYVHNDDRLINRDLTFPRFVCSRFTYTIFFFKIFYFR